METWAHFGLVVATTWMLARGIAKGLEGKGRGWYFSNVVGWTIGAFFGLLVAFMFGSDSWFWNLAGLGASVFVIARSWKYDGHSIKPVEGEALDTVQFDYRNAKGERGRRRLLVRKVDKTYFHGIDLEKREARTFRYDRVIGRVMTESSGELLAPREWAARIGKRP